MKRLLKNLRLGSEFEGILSLSAAALEIIKYFAKSRVTYIRCSSLDWTALPQDMKRMFEVSTLVPTARIRNAGCVDLSAYALTRVLCHLLCSRLRIEPAYSC